MSPLAQRAMDAAQKVTIHCDIACAAGCGNCREIAKAMLEFAAEMMPRSAINEDADALRAAAREVERG